LVRDNYRNLATNIVSFDSWEPLDMDTSKSWTNSLTNVSVEDSASPLSGGLTAGSQAIYGSPGWITYSSTYNSATAARPITMASSPSQAVIFAYEQGQLMVNNTTAAGRRVALGFHRDSRSGLTAQGWALFDAAIAWATIAPPPPAAPTGLTATAGDTQVSLTWNTVAGAASYTIKRSTTSGGPYTTIQSNVTTTSFTNTGLTNGTTYYYVVSAVNTQGESANSSQVSGVPAQQTAPPTGTALLVTNESTLSAGNQALQSRLVSLGYSVTTRLDSAPVDYTGMDVVVFGSITGGNINGKYANPPIGVVSVDSWTHFGLGTAIGFQNTVTTLQVTNTAHPLSGGLSNGNHVVYNTPGYLVWSTNHNTATAITIATNPGQPTQPIVFGYEAGSMMVTTTPLPGMLVWASIKMSELT
jgi:hypothetical protein